MKYIHSEESLVIPDGGTITCDTLPAVNLANKRWSAPEPSETCSDMAAWNPGLGQDLLAGWTAVRIIDLG